MDSLRPAESRRSRGFVDQAALAGFGRRGWGEEEDGAESDLRPLTNKSRLRHLSIIASSCSWKANSVCKPSIVALLALILGLLIGANRDRARQALLVAGWAGAAYACYGILWFLIEPTMTLWREKTAYLGGLTATFINRNTAAAYFGSVSAVWLVLLMESVRLARGPISWRKAPGYILKALKTQFGLSSGRVHVIENWAPIEEIDCKPKMNPWSTARGLAHCDNVLYTGTLGLKHDPSLILSLAAGLQDRANTG